jgi:hypothetical protein
MHVEFQDQIAGKKVGDGEVGNFCCAAIIFIRVALAVWQELEVQDQHAGAFRNYVCSEEVCGACLGLALFTEPHAGNECEVREAACMEAAVLLCGHVAVHVSMLPFTFMLAHQVERCNM